MKLTRIRLEQFKQFRKPLDLRDLEGGLNLFTGPNEAGKSTVVAAIRTAFFERHRSSSVEDLRPWGDSTASPTVELEFSLGGRAYHLTKSFLGKKRCELRAGAEQFDGALAEDHLAELLGFQYASRGASTAQHWGIPGLLWIQQGAGQDLQEPVRHATDHLRTALNESLGEVASSGGDEVLATVEAQRNDLLTTANGNPRGVYSDALKRQDELETALKAMDAAIATYRQKVDTLATLRSAQTLDEAGQPWLAFRAQEQAARTRLADIERLQQALAAERQRATQLTGHTGLLRAQVAAFGQQEHEASTRASAVEAAQQALATASGMVSQWDAKATAASAACAAARSTLRLARQAQTRARLARTQHDLAQQAQAATQALALAETAQASLLTRQAQAAATEINPTTLKRLRTLDARLRELQIRQAAVATRLQFDLLDGGTLRFGDEQLSGTGERLLLQPTTVHIADLGQLLISPGGTDLADLGRQHDVLRDEHTALLQQLGLASLDAADARSQAHTEQLAEVAAANATLKALAPKGIEALRSEATLQATRANEAALALQQLPQASEEATSQATEEVSSEAASLSTVFDAEAAEEATRAALEQLTAQLGQARVDAGNAQATLDAAEREHASALALLAVPDRAARLAAANQALVDALAEQATLAASMDARAAAIAQAGPDFLQQDIERYKRSADQAQRAFEDRKNALLRLEVELEGAGAQGLEERQASLARDLAQAQRRTEELRRRAQALDYLLSLLKEKRSAVTRRLQAPLQKHLNHYLQLLFPHAHLEIDDTLTPGPLTRPGSAGPESGPFDTLSFGAREQMGILSRLAYADLLREAGRPTLILLDDALVHSDEARLAQMKRILFDAATRHQILLFTCHPANWRDLGVEARALGALRGM